MAVDKNLVEGLKTALLDQRSTALLYAQLRDLSNTYMGKDAFAEARRDELDHAEDLTELLEELTGSTPAEATMKVYPRAFSNYCEGLRISIEGEKGAIAEYTDLMTMSQDKEVIATLREIRDDEEVHYHLFCFVYQALCQGPYYHNYYHGYTGYPGGYIGI